MLKIVVFIFIMFVVSSNAFCVEATATLTWDKNPDADYYVVYLREKGVSDFVAIKTAAPITGTAFVLPAPLKFNQDYEYTVKAFNSCGNSSDFSDPVVYNRCGSVKISKISSVKISVTYTVGAEIQPR